MLIAGELDAVTRYFAAAEPDQDPSRRPLHHVDHPARGTTPQVRWLFADRKGAAIDYNKEIGYPQPIHCVIVKTEIVDKDPTIPARLTRAFLEAAKVPSDESNVHAASLQDLGRGAGGRRGRRFHPRRLKGSNAGRWRRCSICAGRTAISTGTPITVDEYFHPSTLGM